MARFTFAQHTPKRRRTVIDRLTQRLESLRVRILRRVLPELLKHIDQQKRILTHVMQIRPEAIKVRTLRFI